MKILFQSRVDLYNPRGGDTIQMEKTRESILKLYPDIQIDIVPEIEVKNINDYDIVHIFNLDWVCESYPQMIYAKEHNKKVVLSAIHHSEQEVLLYEKKARYDIRRIYNFLFRSQPVRDMWKNLYRGIFYHKKLSPTLLQFYMGIRSQQRKLIEMSDIVLVQTEQEAIDIKKDFNVSDFKYAKVINGVDADLFVKANNGSFLELVSKEYGVDLTNKNIILNVGRIEPRKNQLLLLQAFKELLDSKKIDSDWYLIFIGDATSKSIEYKYRFMNGVRDNKNILYLGKQPQGIVASAMTHKGLYAHTSWFETTGLVCMEALAGGMPVISTVDRLKEYFGSEIKYFKPDNIDSLKDAILASKVDLSVPLSLKRDVIENYSWDKAATQTVEIYKQLIKDV